LGFTQARLYLELNYYLNGCLYLELNYWVSLRRVFT